MKAKSRRSRGARSESAFLRPLCSQLLYLGLFIFVNVWTISIHDGEDMVPEWAQVCHPLLAFMQYLARLWMSLD